MKTAKEILEKAKLHKTVWGKRIIAAEERGYFTDEDKRLARSWVTCACGKVTHDIPRNWGNRPIDDQLVQYGCVFEKNIIRHQAKDAANTLIKIEKRAIKVASCK